jgi:hypothetical protein
METSLGNIGDFNVSMHNPVENEASIGEGVTNTMSGMRKNTTSRPWPMNDYIPACNTLVCRSGKWPTGRASVRATMSAAANEAIDATPK